MQCRCGATLVAMNLNEPVPGVYEDKTLEQYIKQDETGAHLPPHIWNTGYQRYKHLFFDPLDEEPLNQALIIT